MTKLSFEILENKGTLNSNFSNKPKTNIKGEASIVDPQLLDNSAKLYHTLLHRTIVDI